MSRITYDFTVVRSDIPGVRLIVAQNEDAFSYLTDEADLQTLPDGSAPLMDYNVEGFITDAERAQLCTALV